MPFRNYYKTEPCGKETIILSKEKEPRDQSLLLPIFNDLDYQAQIYICDKLKCDIQTLLKVKK